MPMTPTHPGVYVAEVASGVNTIFPIPTSITAFIDRTDRGPVNEPTLLPATPPLYRRATSNQLGGSPWNFQPVLKR